ncbi:metallophosphoesterase [Winogradskyella maritima]|nr:metallophosphoesterase [Winogradskyella maritima]
MIPGDLVSDGTNYSHWTDHFFEPSKNLFSEVPVYPVLGNHEKNTTYYFKYFSLPENGTPAYAEHWWYKDYGNVRIIGLDSNDGFRNIQKQYDWLQEVLNDAERMRISILSSPNCTIRINRNYGFPEKKNPPVRW